MPSPANGQESNNTENVEMMKTLTAIGISAAIVFAPLAAIAQTERGSGRRSRGFRHAAPATDADEEAREGEAQEAHGGQEGEEAGGRRRPSRSGRSAEELSLQA